jgi:hypothetical protein
MPSCAPWGDAGSLRSHRVHAELRALGRRWLATLASGLKASQAVACRTSRQLHRRGPRLAPRRAEASPYKQSAQRALVDVWHPSYAHRGEASTRRGTLFRRRRDGCHAATRASRGPRRRSCREVRHATAWDTRGPDASVASEQVPRAFALDWALFAPGRNSAQSSAAHTATRGARSTRARSAEARSARSARARSAEARSARSARARSAEARSARSARAQSRGASTKKKACRAPGGRQRRSPKGHSRGDRRASRWRARRRRSLPSPRGRRRVRRTSRRARARAGL